MIALAVNDAPCAHTISSMNTYATDSRGKRIAWARKQAGMTGHQLARAVGVRNVTISYIENDHRDLSLPLLLKIAEVTGVTVGFLLMETEYPYRQEAPPKLVEPPEPIYISPEADAAAELIDNAPAAERPRMLAVLRALVVNAEQEVEQDKTDDRRKKRVTLSRDDAIFANRLIHRDKVRQSQTSEHVRS